jgi:hypothetical protein
MGVGDHQFDAVPGQLAKKFSPERFSLGRPDVQAKNFSSSVVVDADRDDDRDGDDASGPPDLQISGVRPDKGSVTFQRSRQKGLDPLVDLAARAGDLTFGNAAHAHGLEQVIEGAR